mmetsp:Transcript_38716/g.37058  ORF Transcript_38716/g.37058 Transcript_38716/m.37058 type:complete len:110 (+) Transcript_38716:1578-1907(+)
MISVFEVFALNRNETDFIENLELYGSIIMEQQEDNDMDNLEEDEDLSDPNVAALAEFREQITEEEYEWGKGQIKENNKKLLIIIDVYNKMKDGADFLHSFKRIFNMANK